MPPSWRFATSAVPPTTSAARPYSSGTAAAGHRHPYGGRFFQDGRHAGHVPRRRGRPDCLGNDIGYETFFARQIEWHGRAGDVLIAISWSGKSPNILNGVRAARQYGA